jgi:hypothetical protein
LRPDPIDVGDDRVKRAGQRGPQLPKRLGRCHGTDYIDFKGLGYKGDPIIHGGRFKKLPMGYKPQQ